MSYNFQIVKMLCHCDLFYLQPDLLNFKKGWMTKLYEDGMVNCSHQKSLTT